MYTGTLSSLFENPFTLNIKSRELPFVFMNKIKNEVYVVSDNGTKKIVVEIISENEIIYLKAKRANLIYNIDNFRVKTSLKNVKITKRQSGEYELTFDQIMFV